MKRNATRIFFICRNIYRTSVKIVELEENGWSVDQKVIARGKKINEYRGDRRDYDPLLLCVGYREWLWKPSSRWDALKLD